MGPIRTGTRTPWNYAPAACNFAMTAAREMTHHVEPLPAHIDFVTTAAGSSFRR
ncbi:MAG: hypothetical protein J2P51_06285 [Hyphomicrobiaceae bacterium]|nr:hypothetical protein [Hyphomicrobiaceae bacterium]